MIDWSANNSPKTGKDSIWYCVVERMQAGADITAVENPSTRRSACQKMKTILKQLAGRGLSVLVGFDFPYGYPRGFTKALQIGTGDSWREVWKLFSSRIVDSEQNCSNRFEVAAAFNAAISGQPFPFWGCPSKREERCLTSKRGVRKFSGEMPEFRFTEKRLPGPQSVWKLCYQGSVGSQALLGIPYLDQLRFDPELTNISKVWPFETGFNLAPRITRDWSILHAEIYPSIRPWKSEASGCKDEAQVRGLARHFAEEDQGGRLAALFETPTGFSPEELQCIVAEEGWILGVR
jgi:precorrin-8X/cobalt-precorrin-8 methylmutase